MSRWLRSREDPDYTSYHTRRTHLNARQSGGLMLLLAVAGIAGLLANTSRPPLRVVTYLAALVSTGTALFVLGEVLSRRKRLWAAQGLLAIGAAILLASVGVAAASTLGFSWSRPLVCPMIIGFAAGLPLTWHAGRAIGELKRHATTTSTGFQPLIVAATPVIEPRSPSSQPAAHPNDSSHHRTDRSR